MKINLNIEKVVFWIGLTVLICALAFIWFAPNGMLNSNPNIYGIVK
jgi:hypothetical protein